MPRALETHLADALELLVPAGDIVADRPQYDAVPEWAAQRGWTEFLLGLSDAQVIEAEQDPATWLATAATPASLSALGHEASRLAALYAFHSEGRPAQAAPKARRHVKKRKSAQLHALCEVATRRFGGVSRIVDLGSGHGHLTRALALALRPNEALGIDWDDARIARAIDLSGGAETAPDEPRFVRGDASVAAANELVAGDLVTGLHPCGALGDALVSRARAGGAHVMAVSCCYQKTPHDGRDALSAQAQARGFVVPQHALGLANLSAKSFEGSGTLDSKRAGRRTRLALRLALEARGLVLEAGAEGRGVGKDQVRHGLPVIAPGAFAAHDLSAPTAAEIRDAEHRASRAHAHVSRLALPRHALARALELAIVLDRARYLQEGGWRTDVVALFPASTSPRNLGILANAPE